MLQSTSSSANRSMELYSHKHDIAEEVRIQSKKNWKLINKQKNELREDNIYMRRRKEELANALKEVNRINQNIK